MEIRVSACANDCGRAALSWHPLCAKCDDDAVDDDGYEPSDPKSSGYAERMYERADHERKAERENR